MEGERQRPAHLGVCGSRQAHVAIAHFFPPAEGRMIRAKPIEYMGSEHLPFAVALY